MEFIGVVICFSHMALQEVSDEIAECSAGAYQYCRKLAAMVACS